MAQTILIIWIVAAVVLVIIEALNTGILAIWFAIGCACAAIVAWVYPGSYIAQLVTFLIVSSVLTFIGTRIFKNKQAREKRQPVYSILGKTAMVTKEITNITGDGQITINGDKWSAKSSDGSVISENTKVKIIDIDGVKAVVTKLEEED